MGMTNLWPLGLAVLIPGIILLYLLKTHAVPQRIPALNLWKEAYENVQAQTPWEKFRHYLLMYLQILALILLILALMMPYLHLRGGDSARVVLCMDLSGSMNGRFDEKHSKLEEAKRQAKQYVSQLKQGTRVTLLTGGRSAKMLANDVTDLDKIQQLIQEQQPTDAEGNLQSAVRMLLPIVKQWDEYQMIGFTDESVELGEIAGEIIDLSTEYDNCSVDWVSHTENEEGSVTVQAKIENHGGSQTSHEINLYLGENLYDVQQVSLDAGDSQIITFLELSEARFHQLRTEGGYLRAEINEKDGLEADNTAYALLDSAVEKRVLLVSRQNQFLEKALTLDEDVILDKVNSTKNMDPEKQYDLIVYDGQMPKQWYGSENVLIVNPPKDVTIEKQAVVSLQKKKENIRVTVPTGALLSDMEEFSFGCGQARGVKVPSWAYSFCNDGTDSVGYTGTLDGRSITVLGYDLHDTDLPLQMEFPILIQNILHQTSSALSLSDVGLDPFDPADLLCRQEVTDLKWQTPDEKTVSGVLQDGHGVFADTARSGLYKVSAKLDSSEWNQYFTVAFPTVESEVHQGISVTGEQGKKLDASQGIRQVFGSVSLLKPILILLLILLIVEWLVYRRKQPVFGSKAGKRMTYGLRLAVIALVVGALFGLSVTGRRAKPTTLFLIDASDSFLAHQEEAVDQVRDALDRLPAGEQAGVLVFGGDSNIEQFVSAKTQFEGLNTMPVTSETNLEQAVQTAMSLYPEYSSKRLVLLTDGAENAGDLSRMSSSLLAAQVDVQVEKWESTPGAEVYLSDLSVPERIAIGESFSVDVEVESTVHTGARLQLYNDNTLRREELVDLQVGTNRFSFQDVREKGGFSNYRAIIIPDQDTVQVNNEYVAYTEASEKKPVLLVEGKKGETKEFQKVLNAASYPYQVVTPSQAPGTVSDLNRYVSVLLENVFLEDLSQGFLDSVESYVKDYGGGLVSIGGDQSYALGGYRDTVLEKILPVNMDHKNQEELPKMAMVMVVDHSSSMTDSSGNNESKLNVAKKAAAGALKNLRDTDMVGVLCFDDTFQWSVKLDELKDRDQINKRIMGIKEGGSTSIFPALQEAYKALEKADAQIKHIVLLTDGQDNGSAEYKKLLQNSEKEGITVSTVAVGKDADQPLLERIANLGRGRTYLTDGAELPRIFAQEIYYAQGDFLVNRDFTPVLTAESEIMQDIEAMPELRGYVATSLKDSATAVLKDDTEEDPILAEWHYGLGTTLAFTSDVSNEWTGNYATWKEYPMFWSHLIDESVYHQDDDSRVMTSQEGNVGIVRYENEEMSGDAKVTAIYTDQAGEQQEISLDAVSGGAYEGRIPLGETGVYTINVRESQDGELQHAANVQLTMQYSAEYRYTSESSVVDRFLAETGGKYIDNLQEIYQNNPPGTEAKMNLTMPFLIVAVVLWMLDILNRRLPVLANGTWLRKIRKHREERRGERMRRRAGQEQTGSVSTGMPAAKNMEERSGAMASAKSMQTSLESASEMPDGGKQGSQIDSLRKQRKFGNNVGPLSDLQYGQDAELTKQQIKENKRQQKLVKKEQKAEERRKKQAGPELLDVGSLLQKQQERKR